MKTIIHQSSANIAVVPITEILLAQWRHLRGTHHAKEGSATRRMNHMSKILMTIPRLKIYFERKKQTKEYEALIFENLDPNSKTFGALRLDREGIHISRQRNADNTNWIWVRITTNQEENRMIKLKDAVEKYGEYEIDEKKFEDILVKPKPKSVWDLKKGDIYYFVDNRGCVIQSTWDNDEYDNQRLIFGNIFLTSKEAEFEAERRKVEAELLKLGGTRDMMSLGDNSTLKYCMYYNHLDDETIYINCFYTANNQGIIFFKTEKDCQRAIQEIGEDRIKKYIFYVKE